jgi:hypothetical protein
VRSRTRGGAAWSADAPRRFLVKERSPRAESPTGMEVFKCTVPRRVEHHLDDRCAACIPFYNRSRFCQRQQTTSIKIEFIIFDQGNRAIKSRIQQKGNYSTIALLLLL